MADNVAITAGTGTTIAADDVGAGVLVQRVKACLGADGTAVDPIGGAGAVSTAVQRMTLASDDPLVTKQASFSVAATFTPAATSHTAKDVNGGAQTFASVGTSATSIMINSVTMSLATTTPVTTAYRLHLFNAAPTVIADDAAFTLASTDIAKYLGYIDLGVPFDLDSTAQWCQVDSVQKQVKLASADIIGYLVNLTTQTQENIAHVVTLNTMAV